jgi:alpha/beta superfamily hydrolase
MKPFFFGPATKPLFGVHHPPVTARERPGAVLLCNPFGQEAIQSHRVLLVLATRLSKVGLHALRFDYFATGDSAGASEEGTQAQWIQDVALAHRELARLSGESRIAWVGLRHGATLAALAARTSADTLSELVLWDPVVSGPAYLRELEEAHVAFMRNDLAQWQPSVAGKEAMGFPLSDVLRGELNNLDLAESPAVRARHVTLIGSKDTPALSRLRDALEHSAVSVSYELVETGVAWNSDEAMNARYVPAAVLNKILDSVQGAP